MSRDTSDGKTEIAVTFSVECLTAVKAQSDFAKAISDKGIIYPAKKLTLPSGATVEDALKASGVVYQAEYGYVKAIAKFAAGAVGEESSWFYSVNGTYPPEAFNTCRLRDGDTLVWRYSLDAGRDIGVR